MEMIETQILACTLRTTPGDYFICLFKTSYPNKSYIRRKPFDIFLILLLIDFTKCVYKLIALNIANVLFRAVF